MKDATTAMIAITILAILMCWFGSGVSAQKSKRNPFLGDRMLLVVKTDEPVGEARYLYS